MTDEAQVAAAGHLWALLEPEPNVLRKALKGAIRTEERAAPGEIALSITPRSRAGVPTVSLTVAVDGEVRDLLFDPESATFGLGASVPEPERVPHQVRSLSALEVPDGRWFNVEEAPTPEAWPGHPVLVIVTDPG